jgi:hypothetical protein
MQDEDHPVREKDQPTLMHTAFTCVHIGHYKNPVTSVCSYYYCFINDRRITNHLRL